MSLLQTNRNPSRRELRVFSTILPAFSLLMGWLLQQRTGSMEAAGFVVGLGTIAGLAGLCSTVIARRIYVTWMTIVSPIGFVVSFVLMGLIFFGVVWPIGVLLRWRKGDFLQLKFDRDAKSYWQPLERSQNPRRYFRQY